MAKYPRAGEPWESNRFLSRLRAIRKRPVLIAHRGDSFRAPENTLEAARLARQAGADAWELDVRFTSDHVAIVIHDETLVRTTDVATRFADDARARCGFRVCDFTFEEIRSLDAGSWFVDDNGGPRSAKAFGTLHTLSQETIGLCRSRQVKVPSLEQALELTAELDWLVNVEVKPRSAAVGSALRAMTSCIKKHSADERVLISSFDHPVVARAATYRQRQPGRSYALGILTDQMLHRFDSYVSRSVGADTVHVSLAVLGGHSDRSPHNFVPHRIGARLIERLHERGIPALVFTVNEHAPGGLADALAESGADAIFTDDPSGFLHWRL
jgi:glycerophosphoryl diester phosphodiesterase